MKTTLVADVLKPLTEARDGVYAVDMDQRVIFWNRAAERIMGYSTEEAVGKYCYQILGGMSKEAPVSMANCYGIEWVQRKQVAPSHNVLTRTKDGEPKWVCITLVPLPVPSPDQGTLVHIFHDVTAEMEAVGRLERLKELLYADSERRVVEGSPGSDLGNSGDILTARELQILNLLSEGMGTEDIAEQLVISPTTVRNHIEHILAKLNVHTRLEAVVDAKRHGII